MENMMAKRFKVRKKKSGSRYTPRRDARLEVVGIMRDSLSMVAMFRDGKDSLFAHAEKRNMDLKTHPETAEAYEIIVSTEKALTDFIVKQDQQSAELEKVLKGKADWAAVKDNVTFGMLEAQHNLDVITGKVGESISVLASIEWPEETEVSSD